MTETRIKELKGRTEKQHCLVVLEKRPCLMKNVS